MGLADVRMVFPTRLSLGMARRVALARAFIIEPTLLLMDEPFVSLDEPTAERLRRLLLDTLRAHPATVLFVTHNLREAITLADRIALLAPAPTRVLREIECRSRASGASIRPRSRRAGRRWRTSCPASRWPADSYRPAHLRCTTRTRRPPTLARVKPTSRFGAWVRRRGAPP